VPGPGKSDDETENEELDAVVPGIADDEDDALETDDLAASDEDDEDLDSVPATATGKASAERLLELFLEKKALVLHAKKPGKGLIEGVARILEGPLPVKAKATKLSDTLVDSDDVDDFFLDDETLIEILKRW
jgi:hypothetical protein